MNVFGLALIIAGLILLGIVLVLIKRDKGK